MFLRFTLPILVFAALVVVGFEPANASPNFSLAASKIAPLFKSAIYNDGSGNVLPYRFFEPSPHADLDKKFPVILYLHG